MHAYAHMTRSITKYSDSMGVLCGGLKYMSLMRGPGRQSTSRFCKIRSNILSVNFHSHVSREIASKFRQTAAAAAAAVWFVIDTKDIKMAAVWDPRAKSRLDYENKLGT